MNNDTIQPRDEKETSILAMSAKIGNAILLIGTTLIGVLASVKGLDWLTANLPALLGGVSAFIGGGVAIGLAVRRMKIDKAAKTLSVFICMAVAMILQGCVGTMMEIPIKISPPSQIENPQFVVVKVKRLAFCNAIEMPKISYIPSTGEIAMEGYKSDGGSASIEKACEGATRGAVQGAKGSSGL